MNFWYPRSNVSWQDYLRTNGLIRDVSGQITRSQHAVTNAFSEQTLKIVASQDDLRSSMQGGFNNLSKNLQNVSSTLVTLNADFNYYSELTVEQLRLGNHLLSKLLDRLDAIHKTLESPTLTQAREFYRIGCERLTRGLLDKALEAFLQAEVKNDTDFFIQFKLGKLYLYGIDEDDNVIDLDKAKSHLLQASRYAKAEIRLDEQFAALACEALLHASIAIYAQVRDRQQKDQFNEALKLLEEARKLATDAISQCHSFPEPHFHYAKYSALLNDVNPALGHLRTAVFMDRNYALKVDQDPAFDPIRSQVIKLLEDIRGAAGLESNYYLKCANEALKNASNWHPEESDIKSEREDFIKLIDTFQDATNLHNANTYFGYLEAIPIFKDIPLKANEILEKRRKALMQDMNNSLGLISRLPDIGKYGGEVDQSIAEVKEIISVIPKHPNSDRYDLFMEDLAITHRAVEVARKAFTLIAKIRDENYNREQLKGRRIAASWKRSRMGAKRGLWIGALTGGLIGCVSCMDHNSTPRDLLPDFNLLNGSFFGAILGIFIGYISGYISGRGVE